MTSRVAGPLVSRRAREAPGSAIFRSGPRGWLRAWTYNWAARVAPGVFPLDSTSPRSSAIRATSVAVYFASGLPEDGDRSFQKGHYLPGDQLRLLERHGNVLARR